MWPSDCLPATSGHLTATIRKTWQQPTTQKEAMRKKNRITLDIEQFSFSVLKPSRFLDASGLVGVSVNLIIDKMPCHPN